MRVLVCGGRTYNNRTKLFDELTALRRLPGLKIIIIQGGARGADALAKEWARLFQCEMIEEPADWSLGRAAGSIRNALMLSKHKPDLVVAFPGGRGTANMVRLANDAGVKVVRIER